MDPFQNEYGDDRLTALWSSSTSDAPGEFIERLMRDVAEFRGAAAQSDDMTALVVGRRPGA